MVPLLVDQCIMRLAIGSLVQAYHLHNLKDRCVKLAVAVMPDSWQAAGRLRTKGWGLTAGRLRTDIWQAGDRQLVD